MKLYMKDRDEEVARARNERLGRKGWDWRVVVTADPSCDACELHIGDDTVDASMVTLFNEVLRHIPGGVDHYVLDFEPVREVRVDPAELRAPFAAHDGAGSAAVRITRCQDALRDDLIRRGFDTHFQFI